MIKTLLCFLSCTTICFSVSAGTVFTRSVGPTPKFIPPHVGNGDRDFHGNGPNVLVAAQLFVANSNEIWAKVIMTATESGGDGTQAIGEMSFRLFTHDRPIRNIFSDSFTRAGYKDRNHAIDVLRQPASELVDEFHCVGDTKGNEAGISTGVTVFFNPITFEECTPLITSPLHGTRLSGPSVTFYWTPECLPVNHWWLYVGTSPGHADILNSGLLTNTLSTTVQNLPTNGQAVYVRLWFYVDGAWQFRDMIYAT